MSVRDMLAVQEQALRQQLDLARGSLKHATSKGDVLERATRDWLRAVLPRRLWVGRGEIVDTTGARSKQHDVIIAFDDHPRFFDEETPQPFLIEGVAAVLEVKTSVTRNEVSKTQEAGEHLRTLTHDWARRGVTIANGTPLSADAPHQASFTASPPFALLGFESQIPICDVSEMLPGDDRSVDAIFLLKEPGGEDANAGGWAIHIREGEFRYRRTGDGHQITGWHHHHDALVLVELITWLDAAINYRQLESGGILRPYAEAIEQDPQTAE